MPPKSDKGRLIKRQVTAPKNNDVADRIQKSITDKFTDEQLTEFRDLFGMFDKDNQGICMNTMIEMFIHRLFRFSHHPSISHSYESCWSNTNRIRYG